MTWFAFSWFAAYLLLGSVTGFFAGMLGIGGGLMMVPVLTMLFVAQGFQAAQTLHLALGTSLAAIIFTSWSSLRAHHSHHAVIWPVVRIITPGILVGTAVGTHFAAQVPARPLAFFFTAFVVFVAIQMILNLKPHPSRNLPGTLGVSLTGLGIGAISALVAIGGGSLTVPFLTWCNVRIQNAIGTSAAVGFPIALGGSLGYLYNGWNAEALPEFSLGYIYLPAVLGLIPTSMLAAPYGARLAHKMPVSTLKRIFAGILILLAGKMLWSLR